MKFVGSFVLLSLSMLSSQSIGQQNVEFSQVTPVSKNKLTAGKELNQYIVELAAKPQLAMVTELSKSAEVSVTSNAFEKQLKAHQRVMQQQQQNVINKLKALTPSTKIKHHFS